MLRSPPKVQAKSYSLYASSNRSSARASSARKRACPGSSDMVNSRRNALVVSIWDLSDDGDGDEKVTATEAGASNPHALTLSWHLVKAQQKGIPFVVTQRRKHIKANCA